MFALRDMAVKEGYAPPDLLEKIDKITTAANEFRRDCIYAILREGDISMEQIRKNVDGTLEYIKENG